MKKRDEIEEKYKADLTLIYKDENDIEKDIKRSNEIVNEICKLEGNVLKSASNFSKLLSLYQEFNTLLYKVYVYYYFKYDLDMTDTKVKEYFDSFELKMIEWDKKLTFVKIELNKITSAKWKKLKEEDNSLVKYDYYVSIILRNKKHKLKDNEEKFLSKLYGVFGNHPNTYNILTNADTNFKPVLVDGKEEELNEGNYISFLINPNKDVRRQAFENLNEFYINHKHTISELYKTIVHENNTFCKISKFKNQLEAEMEEGELPLSVYQNLIDFIKSKSSFYNKAFTLFKKDKGLDKMHSYDLYYNIHDRYRYTYDEAIELSKKALSVLGNDYIELFTKGIEARWIDVYPSLHKNSSQYSIGAYGIPHLIHLNFNGTFDDVSTIVHEMGHSIHGYLSEKNNEFVYADTSILATEVASTVNEQLLANYILNNSTNKDEKLFILDHLISLMCGTVFSQVKYAEFEMIAHYKDADGEVLSLDSLCDIYLSVLNNYPTDALEENPNSKYGWMRIPHLFNNGGFYVFKYAIDFLIASGIVNDILNNKNNMKEKYINFLKSGSSKPDKELFKELGFDITKTKYMENAFNLFENYLNMYEELLK